MVGAWEWGFLYWTLMSEDWWLSKWRHLQSDLTPELAPSSLLMGGQNQPPLCFDLTIFSVDPLTHTWVVLWGTCWWGPSTSQGSVFSLWVRGWGSGVLLWVLWPHFSDIALICSWAQMIPINFDKFIGRHLLILGIIHVYFESGTHGWWWTGSVGYIHNNVQSHPVSVFVFKMELNILWKMEARHDLKTTFTQHQHYV